jgi:hypothetical protein
MMLVGVVDQTAVYGENILGDAILRSMQLVHMYIPG